MPAAAAVSAPVLTTSAISTAFRNIRNASTSDTQDRPCVGVREFIEAPWGLNFTPYPTQVFILKLLFGDELDGKHRNIVVRDMWGSKTLHKFSEREYLHYLHEEGRCSIAAQDDERVEEIIWNGGRKSTKSSTIALAIGYQSYRFLSLYDPFSTLGLMEDNEVRITSLGSNEDQAGIVYAAVDALVSKSPFFLEHLNKLPKATQMELFTRKQLDTRREGGLRGRYVRPGLVIRIAPATARGTRGPNNIGLIFDELAHFEEKGNNRSGASIYKALKPSIAAVSRFAMTLSISSPGLQSGQFYELYRHAMDIQESSRVYLETPSAEFNPSLRNDFLAKEYRADKPYFLVEYGARWDSSLHKFIQDEVQFERCFTDVPQSLTQTTRGIPHYAGIDVGTEDDGTVYAISHAEGEVVVVDCVVWYYPGIGKYAEFSALPLMQQNPDGTYYGVVDDLCSLSQGFVVEKGYTDQHNGKGLADLAGLRGIHWIEVVNVGEMDNYLIAETFKTLYLENRLRLPNIPGVKQNIKALDRVMKTRRTADGKFMYKVQAPSAGANQLPPEGHDDIWSAVSRSVYLTYVEDILTGRSKKRAHRAETVKANPTPQKVMTAQEANSPRMSRLNQLRGGGRVPTRALRRKR